MAQAPSMSHDIFNSFLTTDFIHFHVLLYSSPEMKKRHKSPHRPSLLDISTTLFWLWELACALAPNVTSLLIFRLFAGLGASASLSVGGGVIFDLFDDNTRGGARSAEARGLAAIDCGYLHCSTLR